MRRPLASLVAALLLSGCSWFDFPEPAPPPDALTDTPWRLDSIAVGDEPAFVPEGEQEVYDVVFRDDGSVEGRNACNTCGGTYELGDGDAIEIALVCTEAACGEDVYLGYPGLVSEAQRYEVDGARLRVYATGGDGGQRVLYHHATEG